MTKGYAIAKEEAKKAILKYGIDNILNEHFTEIRERTGVSFIDLTNAFDYYRYSPKAAKYRV